MLDITEPAWTVDSSEEIFHPRPHPRTLEEETTTARRETRA
ncbi:MAG: hypothetical protein PHN90_10500 [Methanothrix sp.]|nr:hypothetical protein [Methanothrix sp.]